MGWPVGAALSLMRTSAASWTAVVARHLVTHNPAKNGTDLDGTKTV